MIKKLLSLFKSTSCFPTPKPPRPKYPSFGDVVWAHRAQLRMWAQRLPAPSNDAEREIGLFIHNRLHRYAIRDSQRREIGLTLVSDSTPPKSSDDSN